MSKGDPGTRPADSIYLGKLPVARMRTNYKKRFPKEHSGANAPDGSVIGGAP
jgi:hypothetical protein